MDEHIRMNGLKTYTEPGIMLQLNKILSYFWNLHYKAVNRIYDSHVLKTMNLTSTSAEQHNNELAESRKYRNKMNKKITNLPNKIVR